MPLKRTTRGGLIFVEKIINGTNIGATTDVNTDVDVNAMDEIIVNVRMTTGTTTDLVVSVRPYEAALPDGSDATTLSPLVLPAVESVAPAVVGSEVVAHYRIDVSAYERVQVRVRNASASSHVTHAIVRAATSDS